LSGSGNVRGEYVRGGNVPHSAIMWGRCPRLRPRTAPVSMTEITGLCFGDRQVPVGLCGVDQATILKVNNRQTNLAVVLTIVADYRRELTTVASYESDFIVDAAEMVRGVEKLVHVLFAEI